MPPKLLSGLAARAGLAAGFAASAFSLASLWPASVHAQQSNGQAAPDRTDPHMIVKPPARMDRQMTQPAPAPRDVDPGFVEKPPADAGATDRDSDRKDNRNGKPRPAPSPRSPGDNCAGSAAPCKQDPSR